MAKKGKYPTDSGNNDSYKVGFGRPPKKNQFQPGQSGNLAGRTKGSKNGSAAIDEVLRAFNRPVTLYNEKGRPYQTTALGAATLRQLKLAAEDGNTRAYEACTRVAMFAARLKEDETLLAQERPKNRFSDPYPDPEPPREKIDRMLRDIGERLKINSEPPTVTNTD